MHTCMRCVAGAWTLRVCFRLMGMCFVCVCEYCVSVSVCVRAHVRRASQGCVW